MRRTGAISATATRTRSVGWSAVAARVGAGVVVLLMTACAAPRSSSIPKLPTLEPSHVSFDGDVGDPFVLRTGTGADLRYELYGTDDWPAHVPTAESADLATWRAGPDALPTLPAWADPDPKNSLTWAPAALGIDGRYLLYVSVQEKASRRQCIAVTASSVPLGPFADALGGPLVCQRELGGSIDPSVARDPGGGLHLVWKNDGNCCALPTSLWAQDLRPDGLGVTASPHRLLTADRPWQGGIVENPALLPASRGWWLFYSANEFDLAAYSTGLAWCPSLDGPCRNTADAPFLAGASGQLAPGGLDFFTDADGSTWAMFATWSRPPRNGRFYCCRPVSIARVLTH